jgi:hypothetical protein
MAGYTRTKCTLVQVRVGECPNGGGFIAIWKRQETGGSVVESPFALRTTLALAETNVNDYPLNATYDCMCNGFYIDPFPMLNCNFNDACMLDTRVVDYMQHVGTPYSYSGDALVVIGALLLVCFVFGTMFMLAGNGFCDWCCCCDSARREKVDDVYVIDSSKD